MVLVVFHHLTNLDEHDVGYIIATTVLMIMTMIWYEVPLVGTILDDALRNFGVVANFCQIERLIKILLYTCS